MPCVWFHTLPLNFPSIEHVLQQPLCYTDYAIFVLQLQQYRQFLADAFREYHAVPVPFRLLILRCVFDSPPPWHADRELYSLIHGCGSVVPRMVEPYWRVIHVSPWQWSLGRVGWVIQIVGPCWNGA